MKALTNSTKSFGENVTKRAILFLAIFFWLIICSIAHGSIGLTVNGDDPVVSPLELKASKSLEIGVIDSDSTETSYDLTLSATGGVFLCEGPTSKSVASSTLLQNETVDIQTSDLSNIGKIYFEFQYDPGVAIVSLTTNQAVNFRIFNNVLCGWS
ncbi:MAG TPA: hypothetical protein PLE88_11925 [Anaerohalosphaeraceae bacterium]|nr:hypothetical protein [Anaerohalosphaeraceae bacterium]